MDLHRPAVRQLDNRHPGGLCSHRRLQARIKTSAKTSKAVTLAHERPSVEETLTPCCSFSAGLNHLITRRVYLRRSCRRWTHFIVVLLSICHGVIQTAVQLRGDCGIHGQSPGRTDGHIFSSGLINDNKHMMVFSCDTKPLMHDEPFNT